MRLLGRVLCWLKDTAWLIWIPDYEGGGPWHLRWRAELMYWVRRVWFMGRKQQCLCTGCDERVERASASGLCIDCASENCQHDDPDGYEWMTS